MSYHNNPRIVTDGLALCLDANAKRSYSGTGNTWYDLSGNGYNGTLTNSPTYNSSGYFDLDGTDDYIPIPQFDFTSTHSLEWWFNTDNLTEKYSGGGGYAGHMLCWGHSPSERVYLKTDGSIAVYIHDGSSAGTFTTSNLTLPYTSDEPTNLEITASTNTTGSTRSDSFTITYYNPDGTEIGTEVIYVNQEAQLYYLLQENGDYLLTETYDKIILE